MDDKWLIFRCDKIGERTDIYSVVSKCSNSVLGIIKWYAPWRHYCYFPTDEITLDQFVYSDRCLISIGEYIEKLNLIHKQMLAVRKKNWR